MAWSASGLFVQTFVDLLDDTQLAIDLSLETHKAAFWGSAVTPDFSQSASAPAYGVAPWDTGESSGAGYTAGGITVTGTTVTLVTGSLKFDADDFSIPSSTITAEGYLLYADVLVGNNAILAVWFGSALTTNNGTFSVTHSVNGIAQIDLTP